MLNRASYGIIDNNQNQKYSIISNFGKKNPSIFFQGVAEFDMKNLKKIGLEYIKNIKKKSKGSKKITDKLPVNFLNIGFIKLILPNAKIVHCYRNSQDNCFSIYKNLFTSGKITFAYDLNEIIEYYQLYKNLMNYWNDIFHDKIYAKCVFDQGRICSIFIYINIYL